MNFQSVLVAYLNFTIEFAVPRNGKTWENEIITVFHSYFSGYLVKAAEHNNISVGYEPSPLYHQLS